METEHLKCCPFCGGKAAMKTGKDPLDGVRNYYRVYCTECGAQGKMFLDGVAVDKPDHLVTPKEAAEQAATAWNQQSVPRWFNVANDFLDVYVLAEKTIAVIDELRENYFSENYEGIKKHERDLLRNYDRTRVLVDIAHDYAWEANRLAEELNDKLSDY